MVYFYSFVHGCPIFQTPKEETLLFPTLYSWLILTILNLQSMNSEYLPIFFFSIISSYKFWCADITPPYLNYSDILISFDEISFNFFDNSFLVYRHTTDFHILLLYPMNLMC